MCLHTGIKYGLQGQGIGAGPDTMPAHFSANTDNRPYGWLLAGVGMLLVSTDAPFVRWADTDARVMTGLVAAFSLPVYGLILWRRSRHSPDPSAHSAHALVRALRRRAVPFAAVAIALALCQLSFVAAINHTQIANVVAIVAAGPVLAALGARIFLGEHTSRRVWIAIGVAVTGILLIVWPSLGQPRFRGDLPRATRRRAMSPCSSRWKRCLRPTGPGCFSANAPARRP